MEVKREIKYFLKITIILLAITLTSKIYIFSCLINCSYPIKDWEFPFPMKVSLMCSTFLDDVCRDEVI